MYVYKQTEERMTDWQNYTPSSSYVRVCPTCDRIMDELSHKCARFDHLCQCGQSNISGYERRLAPWVKRQERSDDA